MHTSEIEIIIFGNETNSFMGGLKPGDLHLPSIGTNALFIYFGRISNADSEFHWLPYSLELVAPFFLSLDQVYMECADTKKPIACYIIQNTKPLTNG